jgi:hypothetical protein
VADGGFDRHLATGLGHPRDVEEVEDGWLVACYAFNSVEFVREDDDGGGPSSEMRPSPGAVGGRVGAGHGKLYFPTGLAVVPGLGLVVREYGGARLQVFATADAVAMAAMSAERAAWMVGVARAARWRQLSIGV